MQRPALSHFNNQKSDIRFIRSVAAPKQTHPLKVQSAVNIQYASSSQLIPPSFSLFLTIKTTDQMILNLVFNYSQATKVNDLIGFIKSKINMDLVYFTSDNMLMDYFLTLPNRLVAEITFSKLHLKAHPIKIQEPLSLKSIQILKCIGSGGFSKVLLARVAGILMAIKFIDKQFIFKTAKQSIVQNQKTILQICQNHPFITKLFFSFQTNKYIVLGLQFCNGGELFNLLRRVKKMKQLDAKFYFVETLMAIDHLHSKGILYRDLKPQNIIIDAEGHVRLADFGLSKIINRSLTYSFCGSAQYMSPQMLLKKGHSYEVDYYCIGALLYELVTGLPPFYTHNQNQLFNNILNNQLTFPSHAVLSSQLKSFLSKILQKQPEKRFQNIDEIIRDPWIAVDFNKQNIMNKRLAPPYPTAPFNYNFDDGEFSAHQTMILKIIQKETQYGGPVEIRFNNFYYQSKQIIDIRRLIDQNDKKKFMKIKSQSKKQGQLHSRQNSIHSYQPQNYRSSQKLDIKKYPRMDVVQSTLTSTILTPQISTRNVRSTENLQTFLQRYSLQKVQTNKNHNIYTNKQRFSPSVTLKNYKLNNNIYSRYVDKSPQGKIMDNSFSGDFNRTELSKQKSNSLDKSYLPYRKPQQLPSYSKNFYVNYRQKFPNPKVKKSSRNGEKVNFHYGTINRG